MNTIFQELKEGEANTVETIDTLKHEILSEEISVFTKDGDLKTMPLGSSLLDFAYYIHTKIGESCQGGKVNDLIVPISHKLKNGDKISVLTQKGQKPKPYWIRSVITSKAKINIRNALKIEEKRKIKKGEILLNTLLEKEKLPSSDTVVSILLKKLGFRAKEELFHLIGIGEITETFLKKEFSQKSIFSKTFEGAIKTFSRFQKKTTEKKQEYGNLIYYADTKKLVQKYEFAHCCNPVMGDEIFGIITSSKKMKVHRTVCKSALNIYSKYAHKTQKIKWIEGVSPWSGSLVKLQIKGTDRQNLLIDVLEVIKRFDINIKSVSINSREGIFGGTISAFPLTLNKTARLILKLEKVKNITHVNREYEKG